VKELPAAQVSSYNTPNQPACAATQAHTFRGGKRRSLGLQWFYVEIAVDYTHELRQQISELFAGFDIQLSAAHIGASYDIDIDDDLRVQLTSTDEGKITLSINLLQRADRLDAQSLSTLLVLNQAGDVDPVISASIDPGLNSVVLWIRCRADALRETGLLPVFQRLIHRAERVRAFLSAEQDDMALCD
jgi:hypothetical protein